MKKVFAILMALVLVLGGTALAETELSYEGKVVAGETIPVAAPFGGRMGEVPLHKGDPVQEGDTLATIKTTLNYAPVEGTVTGLYVAEGDNTEDINARYEASLYIEPTRKYTVDANSEKAFNTNDNYFIHLGERVYLKCTQDGTHEGTGMVTKLTETGYTIEVTGGEFYLDEKVYVYRDEKYSKEKRIGKGTVKRAAGYYAPDNTVKSPVTGVIESVEKNPGDTAAKGDTLVKIAPTKSFQVEFDVPEEDLFLLEEGAPVEMELRWDSSSEKLYTGKIVSISRMNEEQKEGTDKKVYKAYASFEPDERIRLGMSMLIYLNEAAPAEETTTAEEPEA